MSEKESQSTDDGSESVAEQCEPATQKAKKQPTLLEQLYNQEPENEKWTAN